MNKQFLVFYSITEEYQTNPGILVVYCKTRQRAKTKAKNHLKTNPLFKEITQVKLLPTPENRVGIVHVLEPSFE